MLLSLAVIKMRGSQYNKEILNFIIDPQWLYLGQPFAYRAYISLHASGLLNRLPQRPL